MAPAAGEKLTGRKPAGKKENEKREAKPGGRAGRHAAAATARPGTGPRS